MKTAIIGTGNIGSRLARNLVTGSEEVIVAGSDVASAQNLARSLGQLASAATVAEAVAAADVVIFAVWFDVMKRLIAELGRELLGKIVVDPSNPIAGDGKGGFVKTIPEEQSAGEIICALLPPAVRYVKAFGSLSAESLTAFARRMPPVALFYATSNADAARTVETLITAAGFAPVRAGDVSDAIRIEVFGDLHEFGGLNGKIVSAQEAQKLVAAKKTAAASS